MIILLVNLVLLKKETRFVIGGTFNVTAYMTTVLIYHLLKAHISLMYKSYKQKQNVDKLETQLESDDSTYKEAVEKYSRPKFNYLGSYYFVAWIFMLTISI